MLQTDISTPQALPELLPAAKRPRLLAVLSPPRSFSSVVSTMIGQHPEMYGFPELHLIMSDTLDGVLSREARRGEFLGPSGLLRALAELDGGRQTVASVCDAYTWLYAHRPWSSKQVMDYLMDRVAAIRPVNICVEKSPSASTHLRHLTRQERFYPDALYLHLTRHPLSAVASMQEYVANRKKLEGLRGLGEGAGFGYWALCHRTILTFTRTISPERVFRVKGEDLLSEPRVWLPKICRWAGVDDGAASIEAMLRPEESPYAVPGPPNARSGNDVKFLMSPKLRQGRVNEGNLREALAEPPLRDRLTQKQKDHLLALTEYLGYQ